MGDGGDRMGYLCAKIYTLAFYPSNSLFGVDMALIMLGSAVMLLNTNAHPYIQTGKFSFQVGQLLCHLFVPEFHVVVIRVHCKWRLSDGPECLFSNVWRAFQRSQSKVVRRTFSNVDSFGGGLNPFPRSYGNSVPDVSNPTFRLLSRG